MNGIQPAWTPAWPMKIFWPLFIVSVALIAFLAAEMVLLILKAPQFWLLSLAAPLAALVVGIPAWYRFVIFPGRVTIQRGLAVGAIGSIIAHPVMWMLIFLLGVIIGRPDLAAIDRSLSFLLICIPLSWLYGGWITIPLGALAGGLLVALQRTLMQRARPLYPLRAHEEPSAMDQREEIWLMADDTCEDRD